MLSVAGEGGGGKGKGGAGGNPKLKPPEASDLLQSNAFLSVLDLLSEGPTEGFALNDGTLAIGSERLSCAFYNDIPIKEPKRRNAASFNIRPQDVQKVGIFRNSDLNAAAANLKNSFKNTSNVGEFNWSIQSQYSVASQLSTTKTRVTSSIFNPRSRGGANKVRYKTSYSRTVTNITLKRIGYGYQKSPILNVRYYETNSKGQTYELQPTKSPTITTTINDEGTMIAVNFDGGLEFPADRNSSFSFVVEEIVPKEANEGLQKYADYRFELVEKTLAQINQIESATETESDIDRRIGFIQYFKNISLQNENFYYQPSTEIYPYHEIGDDLYDRTLFDEDTNEPVQIGGGISFAIPNYNENNAIKIKEGQIYSGLKMDSVSIGGIIPFYLGRELATGLDGVFDSGKFITENRNTSLKKLDATLNKRDLIIFDESFQTIFIPETSQKQLSPPINEIVQKPIKVSIFSNFNDEFNFIAADISSREGEEFQSPMPGFAYASSDVQVEKKILGPFKLGGNARQGDGNSDVRKGGDMATWTNQLPVQSPEVAHTHIVTDSEVDSVVPTIVIDALADTQAEGSDIGKQLKQKIRMRVELGFEGAQGAAQFEPSTVAEDSKAQIVPVSGIIFRISPNEFKISEKYEIKFANGDVEEIKDIAGPVPLKENNGNIRQFQTDDSLSTASGISEANLGEYLFTIRDINIEESGIAYKSFEDLDLQVFGLSELVKQDLTGILNITDEGKIEKIQNIFFGGVYNGPFKLAGASFPQMSDVPEILVDVPDDLDTDDQRRISLGLAEGIDIRALALSKFNQSVDFSIEGTVTSPYFLDLDVPPLQKNAELRDLTYGNIGILESDLDELNLDPNENVFPENSWKNVRRFVKVRKLDFETESVLIARSMSLAKITEQVYTPFSYPFSSLVTNTLDARNFSNAPSRKYLKKLKKILVPSNYHPTKRNGKDKRFLASNENFNARRIFKFNGFTKAFARTKNSYIGDSPPNPDNREELGFKISPKVSKYNIQLKAFLTSLSYQTILQLYTPEIVLGVDGLLLDVRDNKIMSNIIPNENKLFGIDIDESYLNQVLKIEMNFDNGLFIMKILKENGEERTLNEKLTGESFELDFETLYFEYSQELFPDQSVKIPGISIGGRRGNLTPNFLKNGSKLADIKIRINDKLNYFFNGDLVEISEFPGVAMKEKFGNHAAMELQSVNPLDILQSSTSLEGL